MPLLGGPFGLETDDVGRGFHLPEGIRCAWLNSGRAALECILLSMPQLPQRAFVPRFTCDTVLQPFTRLGIPVVRYEVEVEHLLHPFPLTLPEPANEQDLLLLTNYFGLSSPESLRAAAAEHPGPCIVDAATALFAEPLPKLPAFYSLRKFAGVPDGGVATAPFPLIRPKKHDNSDHRLEALIQCSTEGAEVARRAFEDIERELCTAEPACMSILTKATLQCIGWKLVGKKRRRNYRLLHRQLASINRLKLPDEPPSAPLCYPLLSGIPNLRDELIDAGLALPIYWPEVIEATDATSPSNLLARSLLPIPLDQRYDAKEILERFNRCPKEIDGGAKH